MTQGGALAALPTVYEEFIKEANIAPLQPVDSK
jgi:hypothetical protein